MQPFPKHESSPQSTPGTHTRAHTHTDLQTLHTHPVHNILYLAFTLSGISCTPFHVSLHRLTSFFSRLHVGFPFSDCAVI